MGKDRRCRMPSVRISRHFAVSRRQVKPRGPSDCEGRQQEKGQDRMTRESRIFPTWIVLLTVSVRSQAHDAGRDVVGQPLDHLAGELAGRPLALAGGIVEGEALHPQGAAA